MKGSLLPFFFTLALVVWCAHGHATHVRAADLKVEPICSAGNFTYRVTIIAYLNTNSTTQFGTSSSLSFGDGSFEPLPRRVAEPRPDLGENISVVVYETIHTYPGFGTYRVGYMERDRNANILNIENSTDVPYVTFLEFTISPQSVCNNLPVLAVPPLDEACQQVTFFHTSGAYDVDGDSLSFELTIPASSLTTAAQYTSPISSIFYSNFNKGNEEDTGPPTFGIDAVTGLLTWNAPDRLGEYNIAFKIMEWRKDSTTGVFTKLSSTTRDMQIVVEQCANQKPQLIIPKDTCVIAGAVIEATIFGKDTDNNAVKIEVFGLPVELDEYPAVYHPNPGIFLPSTPPAELEFHWQTDCLHIRNQPYQVVFKITDDPPDGPKLVTFRIWNIKIVGPPPTFQETQLDIVNKSAILHWEQYSCSNASSIQVWRKVGAFEYQPDICDVGIPRSVGYNLIATISANATTFTDTNFGMGLSPGAMYCYRLVAYFNEPAATPSMVSDEICVGPVKADAPVITHVSVEKTAANDGQIRVSWHSPLDISEQQFPKRTYEYEIFRGKDFTGDDNPTKVGRVTDTTFLDRNLNTEENVFHYRIVLYAQPALANIKIPVDTSTIASSERLSIEPRVGLIQLNWRDSVPWSNVVQSRPYHLIYRGIDSSDPASMQLYDSVNVAKNGYNYLDKGPLENDLYYSYRILTRGTYGNPAIPLQENFSQVVSTYPVSNLLPCTPAVVINTVDCEQYLAGKNCDQTFFANTLSWSVNGLRGCLKKTIDRFNIYVSPQSDKEFTLLAQTSDTTYIDGGLPSFARCYKVSSVDTKGKESAKSEAFCNDNCPFYMLPNVFTPGQKDGQNDTFNSGFDSDNTASGEVIIRCPRFVEQVKFQVFNRWGEQIYSSNSADGSSRNIEWRGVDSQGREVASGIYYYTAEVLFNVNEQSKRLKEFRGWVNLVR